MDNVRNLKNSEIPESAINSVKSMVEDLADALVRDYKLGLNRDNLTISDSDLNTIKSFVVSNVGITMKISLKVDTRIVNDLNIAILPDDQSSITGFNAQE